MSTPRIQQRNLPKALPRLQAGVLRPAGTPTSHDARSLAGSAIEEGGTSVADNFSEGSWEHYRNNFFVSMIPPKKEYGSFGLASVLPVVKEVETPAPSPRFGPTKVQESAPLRRRTSSNVSAAQPSRRSSSYSEAVIAGPPPPKEEPAIPEIVTIKVPVTTPIMKEIEQRNYISTTSFTIGKFSVLDGEVVVSALAEAETPLPEKTVVKHLPSISAKVLPTNPIVQPVVELKQAYETVKVVFPGEKEEKGEKGENGGEPKKEEVATDKKYVPPKAQVPTQTQVPSKDPVGTTLIGPPPLMAIHYDGDAPIRPEENCLGEKRLVSFDFVVGDNIQYIEGKLFYFPRQVVTLQCAPFVHTHDTDFMGEVAKNSL